MKSRDPFSAYRQSTDYYSAKTGKDGLSLELTALDASKFSDTAQEIIRLATLHGWRITQLYRHHPGNRVLEISVAPARRPTQRVS